MIESKQTDEDDLMPYPVLAKIERLAIFEYRSPKEVYNAIIKDEGLSTELAKRYINKFYRLWSINQWKQDHELIINRPSLLMPDFSMVSMIAFCSSDSIFVLGSCFDVLYCLFLYI